MMLTIGIFIIGLLLGGALMLMVNERAFCGLLFELQEWDEWSFDGERIDFIHQRYK